MAYRCWQQNCNQLATIECTCPNSPRFCHNHHLDHSVYIRCYSRSISQEYTLDLIKIEETKNALTNLRNASIYLAEKMILMINTCLKSNLKFINLKKKASSAWLHQTNSETLESINNWVASQNLLQRDQSQFSRSLLKLLDLNKIIGKEEYEIKIEKLEANNKKLYEQLEENTLKLKKLQNELKNTQKICQEKQANVEHLEKNQEENLNKLTKALDKIKFVEGMKKQQEEEFKKKIFESEKGRKNALEKYEELLQKNRSPVKNARSLGEDELVKSRAILAKRWEEMKRN